MGIFDFLKNRKKTEKSEHVKTFIVDNLYTISAVNSFHKVDSEKFRIETENGNTYLTISDFELTEYGGNIEEIKSEDLKHQVLPLYEKFVNEGNYKKVDDLTIEKNYISQSFINPNDETEYHLTTMNNFNGRLIVSNFIMNSIADYSENNRKILLYSFLTMKPIN